MTLAPDWLILALGLGGVFFSFVAAVGLLRLPDVYTRAHATSKSDTLGALLAIGAATLTLDVGTATVKAGFLLAFAFLTNPTAAHAVTRAALDQDIEPWTVEEPSAGSRHGGSEAAPADASADRTHPSRLTDAEPTDGGGETSDDASGDEPDDARTEGGDAA